MIKSKKHLFAALLLGTTITAVNAQAQISATDGDSIVSIGISDVFGQPKTRAEVRADLVLWKKAGLDKFWSRESTPDTHSPDYKAAYVKYVRLRTGSEYTAEVERQLRR